MKEYACVVIVVFSAMLLIGLLFYFARETISRNKKAMVTLTYDQFQKVVVKATQYSGWYDVKSKLPDSGKQLEVKTEHNHIYPAYYIGNDFDEHIGVVDDLVHAQGFVIGMSDGASCGEVKQWRYILIDGKTI